MHAVMTTGNFTYHMSLHRVMAITVLTMVPDVNTHLVYSCCIMHSHSCSASISLFSHNE